MLRRPMFRSLVSPSPLATTLVSLRGGVLAILLALLPSVTPTTAHDDPPPADPVFAVFEARDAARADEFVRRAGGRITVFVPESGIALVDIDDAGLDRLRAHDAVVLAARGPLGPGDLARTRGRARIAAGAWQRKVLRDRLPIAPRPDGSPLDTDILVPPPADPAHAEAEAMLAESAPTARPAGASASHTSEYLAGKVSVSLFLMESSSASVEDWDGTQEGQVLAEAMEAGNSIVSMYPGSELQFVLHAFYGRTDARVRVPCEPIVHAARSNDGSNCYEDAWVTTILGAFGVSGTLWSASRTYADNVRVADKSDWAVNVFVAHSKADTDGMFSDGRFGYAWLGGPHIVMTYDNDGWGIDRFDSVLRHELHHSFFVLDEYTSSNCSCTAKAGYYNIANDNCQRTCLTNVPCVMIANAATACAATRGQAGTTDSDNDGTADVLEVVPTFSATLSAGPTPSAPAQFSGTATVGFVPNRNPNYGGVGSAISILEIAGVEARVDSDPWSSTGAAASDGAFDAWQESFTFDLAIPPGPHTVDLRAYDSRGNRSAVTSLSVTGITNGSISGTIGGSNFKIGNATVTAGGRSATTDAAGRYTISGLANGTYTVTPSRTNTVFSPASRSVTIDDSFATAIDFGATGQPADVALTSGVQLQGYVTSSVPGAGWIYYWLDVPAGTPGLTVSLATLSHDVDLYVNGGGTKPTASVYAARSVNAGTTAETVTIASPAAGRWYFGVTNKVDAQIGFKITATLSPGQAVRGTIGGSNFKIGNATVTIGSKSAVTDSAGNFTVTGLANGTYTVTPTRTNTVFSPGSRSITISGADLTGVNFGATGQPADVALTGGVQTQGYVTSSVPGAGWIYYWLDVPSGTTSLIVGLATLTHDVDLYVNGGGTKPTASVYAGRSINAGTTAETVTIANPAAGRWYFGVTNRVDAQIGFKITATLRNGSSVSGTIGGSNFKIGNATVTIGSKTATTDASGNYTVTGLADGTYTVTPTRTNTVFSPTSRSVTISGADLTAVNFGATGQPADVALTSGVQTQGYVTSSVPGSGWIYYSLDVPSGTAALTVGLATLTHDVDLYVSGGGTKPTASVYAARSINAGTSAETVTIADPAAGRWYFGVTNKVDAQIGFKITATVRTSSSVSGTIGGSNFKIGNATVTIGSRTATTDASGNFTVTGLANGTYTVTPTRTNTVFSPTSRSVTIAGTDLTGVNFGATGQPADVALTAGVQTQGYVTSSVPGSGWIHYWLDVPSGTTSLTVGLATLTHDVDLYVNGGGTKPTASVYAGRSVNAGTTAETVTIANPAAGRWYFGVTNKVDAQIGFKITATLRNGSSVSGTIGGSNFKIGNATVTIGSKTAVTDTSGNFTVTGLANGTYTVTPTRTNTVFSPTSRSITISGSDLTAVNFGATGQPADVALSSGVQIQGYVTSSVPGAGWIYYWLDVPSGATSLTVSLATLTHDVDLYVKGGGVKPTTSSYTARSINAGTTAESVTIANPAAGRWYFGVTNKVDAQIGFKITAR